MDLDGEDMADALEEVSARISKLEIEGKDHFHRLAFQIHNLQKEVAWHTYAMTEFYHHMGFTPSERFAPSPSWPSSYSAPTGYTSWEELVQKNDQ